MKVEFQKRYYLFCETQGIDEEYVVICYSKKKKKNYKNMKYVYM